MDEITVGGKVAFLRKVEPFLLSVAELVLLLEDRGLLMLHWRDEDSGQR